MLDNAISFTRPIGVVSITLIKRWRKPIVIEISDSGPGVNPDLKDTIFERFFTARKGEAHIKNASGLGLFISRQIVEAHNGKIVVSQSELGGAKMSIELY